MKFSTKFRYFWAKISPKSQFRQDMSTSSGVLWTKGMSCHPILTKIKHYSHSDLHILQFWFGKWSFGVHKNFRHFFQNEKRVCQIYWIKLYASRGPSYIPNIMLKTKNKEFHLFYILQGSLKKVCSFGVQTPVIRFWWNFEEMFLV